MNRARAWLEREGPYLLVILAVVALTAWLLHGPIEQCGEGRVRVLSSEGPVCVWRAYNERRAP